MYPPKSAKRSIGAKLKETYFPPMTNVTFSSFYGTRVQSDGHSCGAWLIAAMVAYVLGIEQNDDILSREKIFNLMMVLIENVDHDAKREKAIRIFHNKDFDTNKEQEEQLEAGEDLDNSLTPRRTKRPEVRY